MYSILTNIIKIELNYNGRGSDTINNFSVKINDISKTLSGTTAKSYDYIYNWNIGGGFRDGNVSAFSSSIIKNCYIYHNGSYYHYVKDGFGVNQHIMSRTTLKYFYVPSFDNITDSVGGTVLNKSYPDSWNGCETKIKMPINSVILDNDVRNILYTDPSTPKSLDLNTFYPTFANKIHCDNSQRNIVKDLIVTTKTIDLSTSINGFLPYQGDFYLRVDSNGDGINGAFNVERLSNLVSEENIDFEEHMIIPAVDFHINDSLKTQFISHGSISLHSFNVAFFTCATASEGLQVYNNSSALDKSSTGTTIDMGTIGAIVPVSSYGSKSIIEKMHNVWLIPYPDGITPQSSDDNEKWWEWVIDGFNSRVQNLAGVDQFYQDSYSSTQPGNYSKPNYFHPRWTKLFRDKMNQTFLTFKPDVNITDDLSNNISVFSGATKDSIVTFGGSVCQLLSGSTSTSYGNLCLDDNSWLFAPYWHLKFDVYCLSTTGNTPINSITIGNQIVSFSNPLVFDLSSQMVNYTNTCTTGKWYTISISKIKINLISSYQLSIYDDTNTCIMFTHNSLIIKPYMFFVINCDGIDSYFKNFSIYATWKGEIKAKCDSYVLFETGYVEGDTYDTHLLRMKQYLLGNIYSNFRYGITTHWCYTGTTSSNTLEGLKNRSYEFLKDIITWLKTTGVNIKNYKNFNTVTPLSRRINLIPNGDAKTSIFDISTGTTVWGLSPLTVDSTETTNNSIDGCNVIKGSTTSGSLRIMIPYSKTGVSWLSFWAKGNFQIIFENLYHNNYLATYFNDSSKYVFYKFPCILDGNNFNDGIVTFYFQGDTYLQKLAVWEE